MNNYSIIGRLVKNIEIKESENKKKYAYMTIAVDRTYKDSNDEKITDFIDMIVWNELAERIATYCHKGDLVSVNGRIETRMVDKEDHKEKVMSLVCDKIYFLSTVKKDDKESE